MSGIVGSKLNIRGSGPVAKLGTDGQHLLSSGAGKSVSYETVADTTYDDNKVQANIALLGFKAAVNGSLAKYNLQDQIVDEYTDATGVDAGASTNEVLASSAYSGTSTATTTQDADATAIDGDYTVYKWTDTGSTGSYSHTSTANHDWLVVGGGGGAGFGGGGAGGFRAGGSLSLTGGNTYTVTVGLGSAYRAQGGSSILSGTGITTITSAGGGYGGGPSGNAGAGGSGGSGGGTGHQTTGSAGSGNTPSITPITGETTSVQGYAGGVDNSSNSVGGGGGGSSAVGASPSGSDSDGGDGGAGTANSITGSSVTYAGGGGGAYAGSGGAGGGGAGGADSGASNGTVGTDGLGGGAGGSNGGNTKGGNGIVILRRLTAAGTTYNNLTLQSTDTTAMAEPDYADMVILMENNAGTATINTDIKGYISEDSGSTFTQGTLVDEGTWGTNKKILAFHDLDISAQSGTSMCYKITTHNQSASKITKIHATSIGWKE